MLRLYDDDTLVLNLKSFRELTACANIFRKPLLQVIKTSTGDAFLLPQSKNVLVDVFGYMYYKAQNLSLKTRVKNEDDISRIAFCNNKLSGKRIIEVVELKDGTIIVSPLSKLIITDKLDINDLTGHCTV